MADDNGFMAALRRSAKECECCDFAAAEIKRLRAEVLDWQRTVRAHEAENDELHDDLTRLLQEVGRLRRENVDLRGDVAELKKGDWR